MAYYGRDYGRGGWGGYYGDRGPYTGGGFWSSRPGPEGYDQGYRRGGSYNYDRDVQRGGGPYDRGFKSRWQTDYGDPFGDRAAHTPIRTFRGEFGNEGRGRERWHGYDRGRYGMYGGRGRYDRHWW